MVRSSFASIIALVAVCAFVVAGYAWMGVVTGTEWSLFPPETSHYNLLVQGFRHGQLSLNKTRACRSSRSWPIPTIRSPTSNIGGSGACTT